MDTGWFHVGLGENIDIGNRVWSNPNNISSNSGTYSDAVLADDDRTSDHLRGTQFGFDGAGGVPSGAKILGIELKITKRASISNRIRDDSIQLVLDGSPIGDDKATGDSWPEDTTAFIYGGPTDLWGATFEASDIRKSTFGFQLRAYKYAADNFLRGACVYEAWMKIYYESVSALFFGSNF